MGLDIASDSHDFRAGSYSSFSEFREWLAIKLGYRNYDAYCEATKEAVGKWKDEWGMKEYANKTKLGAIMWHSDCDGYIPERFVKQLKEELIEIKKSLIPLGKLLMSDDEQWYRDRLNNWIKACEGKIYFG